MTFRGKTEGKDIDGQARKLGDRDTMGYIVGFIDDNGNCWENLAERDGAITAGRYQDAMIEWERGGEVGLAPRATMIAREVCLDPANVPDAVREAREGWAFIVRYRETL